ncbi:conserved hypothetical protein [Thermotomaculum hydrothermale]|uniref:Uncharacterized protein n=1 Tax=Thermotomaculum hydrothermale TaxID=981385 RepID=A0A7R6PWI3_9BACT|nr:hypothetical protein [Thermotomaculum hydrothermale]BBB31910.1 conserved hypothetical protein [Thermotomaculum hydrothermale]
MIPGSALIVDDRLEQIKDCLKNSKTLLKSEKEDINKKLENKELNKLLELILYLNRKGIPVTMFSSNDINNFENLIKNTRNIRLVFLDLDIDGDGKVTDTDEEVIKRFIEILIKNQGYFFLFILSNHKEKWENDIKSDLIQKYEFLNHMSGELDKQEDVFSVISNKIRELNSLNIIYSFEKELNKARDIVAKKFVEFNKETWEYLISKQKKEVGDLWEFEMITLLLNLIKQSMEKSKVFLRHSNNDNQENNNRDNNKEDYDNNKNNNDNQENNGDESYDIEMISKIYRSFNYVENVPSTVIFTGNLYKTNKNDVEKEYALILTPECDIAQSKNIDRYVVVYGFNVNDNFNNSYNRTDDNVPIFVKRAGRDRNNSEKWKSFNSLNKIKNPNQYIYLLPFAIEEGKNSNGQKKIYKHIGLDFRIIESISANKMYSWKLKLRVNDPLMVDIQNKFSNLFNRKGIPSLLPEKMKLIYEKTDEDKTSS